MKKSKIFLFLKIISSILVLLIIYCSVSFWGFGEIKSNPFSLVSGRYEDEMEYSINQLQKGSNIQNSILLSEDEIFSENGDAAIFVDAEFIIRNVTINVTDFTDQAVTIHVYYEKNHENFNQKKLLKIGYNSFNLVDATGFQCVVAPTNKANVSVTIESIVLKNYKEGYLEFFWGWIVLSSVFFIFMFRRERKGLIQNDIKDYNFAYFKREEYIWLGLAIIFSVIYVVLFFYLPHVIHPEFYTDFVNYYNGTGGSYFLNLIPKVFDNSMIEKGMYRPRALAFLLQYTDYNLLAGILGVFPKWGIKLPLYLLVVPLSMFTMEKGIRTITDKAPRCFGMFIGAAMLFLPNVQAATYFILRVPKLITPFVALALIIFSLKQTDIYITKKFIAQNKLVIMRNILFMFVLCTLDEQIIAVMFFLLCISSLFTVINRRWNAGCLYSAGSLIIYCSYHLWWGKMIFEYFTPGQLEKHMHNMGMLIKDFSAQYLIQAWDIYKDLMIRVCGNSFILFSLIIVIYLVSLVKIGDVKKQLLSVSLIAFSYFLTLVLLIGLPYLYVAEDLKNSIYFLTPVVVSVFDIIYTVYQNKNTHPIKLRIITGTTIIILVIFHLYSVESYHLIHLGINGGNIRLKEETMDINCLNNFYESVIVTREQYDNYIECKE